MLNFQLESDDGRARAGELSIDGRIAKTPLFMPVATRGVVRTLLSEDLERLGVHALITNAYHLLMSPGIEVIEEMGGLHEFMKWDGIIFTDSGGFQMIRKGFEQDISENRVKFKSEYDGSVFELTPSQNVKLQFRLDTDVAMCLDYCPPHPADKETLVASVEKTTLWAKECRMTDGVIFGISQGGVDPVLRGKSCSEIAGIDFQGYAVGGLSIGESKENMYRMLEIAHDIYPVMAPRYFMGLGSPVELLESIDRGMDMFDSAYPTRNARHGTVFTRHGPIDIRKAKYRRSRSSLDDNCGCPTCQVYDRGYINHLCKTKELSWMRMVTVHNLYFILSLLKEARLAITQGNFKEFKNDFAKSYG